MDKLQKLYCKKHVSKHEFKMHTRAVEILADSVPKIVSYDDETRTLTMELLEGMSVSDFYGEDAIHVPDSVWTQAQSLVSELYKNGIVYSDVTGYNLMEDNNGNLKIIDFEHCWEKGDCESEIRLDQENFVCYFIDPDDDKAKAWARAKSWKPASRFWNPEFA